MPGVLDGTMSRVVTQHSVELLRISRFCMKASFMWEKAVLKFGFPEPEEKLNASRLVKYCFQRVEISYRVRTELMSARLLNSMHILKPHSYNAFFNIIILSTATSLNYASFQVLQ